MPPLQNPTEGYLGEILSEIDDQQDNEFSGIFIDCEEADQELAYRIASELYSKGMPVRFDFLIKKDISPHLRRFDFKLNSKSYVISLISESSMKSDLFVKRLENISRFELEKGVKALFPITIGNQNKPKYIHSSLYFNTSSNYLLSIDKLNEQLRAFNVQNIKLPLEKEFFPLSFTDPLTLDKINFQGVLDRFFKEKIIVDENQIILLPELQHMNLRNKFFGFISDFLSYVNKLNVQPHQIPLIKDQFLRYKEYLENYERMLILGIWHIVMGSFSMNSTYGFSTAAYWFCRILRAKQLTLFEQALDFMQEQVPAICRAGEGGDISNQIAAAKTFQVNSVTQCDIFTLAKDKYFKVWLDQELSVIRDLNDFRPFPDTLVSSWSEELIFKFVIPQMVFSHLTTNGRTPLIWDLDKCEIGFS